MDLELPAEMVERAAQRLHEHDRVQSIGEPDWDGLEEPDRDSYRVAIAVVLTAALEGCDVDDQWAYRSHWHDGTDHDIPCMIREEAEHHAGQPSPHGFRRSVTRRLRIMTPWQPAEQTPTQPATEERT